MVYMDNSQALYAQSETGAAHHITRVHKQIQKAVSLYFFKDRPLYIYSKINERF